MVLKRTLPSKLTQSGQSKPVDEGVITPPPVVQAPQASQADVLSEVESAISNLVSKNLHTSKNNPQVGDINEGKSAPGQKSEYMGGVDTPQSGFTNKPAKGKNDREDGGASQPPSFSPAPRKVGAAAMRPAGSAPTTGGGGAPAKPEIEIPAMEDSRFAPRTQTQEENASQAFKEVFAPPTHAANIPLEAAQLSASETRPTASASAVYTPPLPPSINKIIPPKNPSPPPADDWEMDDVLPPAPATSKPFEPDLDVPFTPKAATPPNPATIEDELLPQWARAGGGGNLPPPELPKGQGQRPAHIVSNVIALCLLGGVVYGAWILVQNWEKTQERLARWTGTLTEVSEKIPAEIGGAQDIEGTDTVQPESIVQAGEQGVSPTITAMPNELELTGSSPTTLIDFADVPPEEQNKPVVATPNDEIPENVGLFANLQKAVLEAREEKNRAEQQSLTGETDIPVDPKKLEPADRKERDRVITTKMEEDLAAYRRALSESDPTELPSPGQFFKNPEKYGQPAPKEEGEKEAQLAVSATLPPPSLFDQNPYNLPLITEPSAQVTQTVRTLTDFDGEVFNPEQPKVRVPRGLKPRISATDFPEMELLSLVEGKGIIAKHAEKEGVLLIGEVLDGWELIAVQTDYAEFKSGNRKHVLSMTP